MYKNVKSKNKAIILNNINREIIEIKLSQKDIQSLLRFRQILYSDISNAKPFDENIFLKIKVLYEDNNYMLLFGGQMFVFENNLMEYYLDKKLLVQNYIINKAYKQNYDKLKQVVYLNSVGK
jgi:hypothetical protein